MLSISPSATQAVARDPHARPLWLISVVFRSRSIDRRQGRVIGRRRKALKLSSVARDPEAPPFLGGSYGKNVLNIHINTNPGVQYHALSGFFAVYNKLNLTEEANLTKIGEKAQDLCSSTWNGLDASGSQYCFKVLYLASILEDGLCLGEADIIFGPGDISWTLGASLVEGERVWGRNHESITAKTTPQYLEIISSPIVLFIILVLMLFVVYHSQIKLPKPTKRSVVGESLPYNYPEHRPL